MADLFRVDPDGRISGDVDAMRFAAAWMANRYNAEVRRRGGGDRRLMGLLVACAESVRVREVVPQSEPVVVASARVEVSVGDAAPLVGCSPGYLRRLARSGRVSSRKVAGVWLIDVTDLLED